MGLSVLVVDDDQDVRALVRAVLEREHIQVVEAGDGAEALARAGDGAPHIAVLDVGLPDVSGLELLVALREVRPALHVIMLTAAGSEDERVDALTAGADDYMVKPFFQRELVARVLAAGRRLRPDIPPLLVHGDLCIDSDIHEATLAGRALHLTPKEFDLLAFLAARPRRTFSRDELLQHVWSSSSEWQGPATVTEHVRRLRAKIEADPDVPQRLVTVRGVGYRFEPVTVALPERPA